MSFISRNSPDRRLSGSITRRGRAPRGTRFHFGRTTTQTRAPVRSKGVGNGTLSLRSGTMENGRGNGESGSGGCTPRSGNLANALVERRVGFGRIAEASGNVGGEFGGGGILVVGGGINGRRKDEGTAVGQRGKGGMRETTDE